MNKRWLWTLPAIALGAVLLVALPGPARPQDPEQELAKAAAKLEAQLAKLEAEYARLSPRLQAETDRLVARYTDLADRLTRERARWADEYSRVAQDKARAAEEMAREMTDHFVWVGDEAEGPGWLGVTISEVTADKAKELKLPAERGVLLTDVEADSPAAKAGLKANDVITEFNGQRVEGTAQLRRMVRETPAGRTVQFGVWRDGRAQTISVQLASRPEQLGPMFRIEPPNWDVQVIPELKGRINVLPKIEGELFALSRTPRLGIDAEELSGQLGNYFGAPEGEGILVRSVNAGSPAEKGGLKAGDVITHVNGERVKSVGDLRAKVREGAEKKAVALSVLRNKAQTTVNVTVEPPQPPAERKRLMSRRIWL